jgi:sulfoxide reductase heme-binding subunit YedZ
MFSSNIRLGGRRWHLLHRLIYVIAAGGVIHCYSLVKSDVRLPVRYGAMLVVFLAYRLPVFIAKRRFRHG